MVRRKRERLERCATRSLEQRAVRRRAEFATQPVERLGGPGPRDFDSLATAAQRGEETRRSGRHQHEQRARGRLLERLQECVLRARGHRLRRHDDRDAQPAPQARHAELLAGLAHLVDGDRFLVLEPAQPMEVRVRACEAERALGALAAGLEDRAPALAEEGCGQRRGEAFLAHARGAVQEHGVRQPSAGHRRLEAAARGRVPRQQGERQDRDGGFLLHHARPSKAASSRRISLSTRSTSPVASTTHTRAGSARARAR